MLQVAAKFNKQDGLLTVSSEGGGQTVQWKAASGDGTVAITVKDITNLQQTPATAAKASIRISADQNYTFQFTSPTARDDQQAVTSTLRQWIEAAKASQTASAAPSKPATPAPAPTPGASGSMAMAQAVASTAKPKQPAEDAFDDARLLRDVELQRSLLQSSPALRQRFDQALRDKPDTITIAQFASQFWATRVHLLRSHAAEKAQGPGSYNVLAVIKTEDNIVDGSKRLNLTKEQIHLIFEQHPLVKRVYNENVPAISEGVFWAKFYSSRLFKKLKGEKITDLDTVDPRLDKYLSMADEIGQPSQQPGSPTVARFLDVEGNEENVSQRLGNRPDFTMRPSTYDKVPILRVLNRMSEKLLENVPPSDADRHAPAGQDEATYKELQLRDLELDAEDNRTVLKIKDQGQLFAASQGLHTSTSAETYAQRTPAQVLATVFQDLRSLTDERSGEAGINLGATIGVREDSSSDEESAPKKPRVGSRSSRAAATTQILTAIKKRHLLNDDHLLSHAMSAEEQAARLGLSTSVFSSLSMAHNTTVEFLHYFWTVFLSGDPDRANEIARLVETLDKSLDRIKAVANAAEDERAAQVEQLRRQNEAYTKQTGKRRRFDPDTVGGGAKVVDKVMGPLVRAIRSAHDQFEKALREATQASIAG